MTELTNDLRPHILFVDKPGQADYKDLAGTKARLNKPGQGVFVFNKEYEDANKEDCYDFYFTDRNNHCIRKLTRME